MDWITNKLYSNTTHTIELTDKDFRSEVKQGNYFIQFYVPWCGICRQLAPTWEQLANTLRNESSVEIAQIDCTEYKSICIEYDVKVYPTLLWFENGARIKKYQGRRSHDNLLGFVELMMKSPVRKSFDWKLKFDQNKQTDKETKNVFDGIKKDGRVIVVDNNQSDQKTGSVFVASKSKEQDKPKRQIEKQIVKETDDKEQDNLLSADVCKEPECKEEDENENDSEEVCLESDGPGSACKKPDGEKKDELNLNDSQEEPEL